MLVKKQTVVSVFKPLCDPIWYYKATLFSNTVCNGVKWDVKDDNMWLFF